MVVGSYPFYADSCVNHPSAMESSRLDVGKSKSAELHQVTQNRLENATIAIVIYFDQTV